jgi:hypothetical protein
MTIHGFFQQMVLRIYMHMFCISLVFGLVNPEFMALFVAVNVLIGPVFIFEPCS